MKALLKIGNHFYDIQSEHFSLHTGDSIANIRDLINLKQFSNLKSASFSDSDLNDEGLSFLSDFIQIENLCLQGTEITNDGIKYLKKLSNLNHLRLKDNPQLTNECIPHLIEIENLQDLGIHETSIDQDGLEKLVAMKQLKNIVLSVWENNFTYERLLRLSIRMPDCSILAKGDGEFCNGNFEGEWRH